MNSYIYYHTDMNFIVVYHAALQKLEMGFGALDFSYQDAEALMRNENYILIGMV